MAKASTSILLLTSILTACSGGGNNSSPPQPMMIGPNPGQWTVYGGNVGINNDGSFTFGNTGGPGQGVGYIYTGYNGNPIGKTMTLTYNVSGTGNVLPSQASGQGPADVRLFLWRRGDDIQCSTGNTEWFRFWGPRVGQGGGPLTNGSHVLSVVVDKANWSDCLGSMDVVGNQFGATTSNLIGVGYTFGAEYFGHGVFSTGQQTFKGNLTIQ